MCVLTNGYFFSSFTGYHFDVMYGYINNVTDLISLADIGVWVHDIAHVAIMSGVFYLIFLPLCLYKRCLNFRYEVLIELGIDDIYSKTGI